MITRPKVQGPSGRASARSGQATAQGKPSHMWQGRDSGTITGVPAPGSTHSASTWIAFFGQAFTQSPQPVQRARKSASPTAPGGRRRAGSSGSRLGVRKKPRLETRSSATITSSRSACSCRAPSGSALRPKPSPSPRASATGSGSPCVCRRRAGERSGGQQRCPPNGRR